MPMSMIRYLGPHDEARVDELPGTCKRGATVDAPDELAARLVLTECWESADEQSPALPATESQPAAAGEEV